MGNANVVTGSEIRALVRLASRVDVPRDSEAVFGEHCRLIEKSKGRARMVRVRELPSGRRMFHAQYGDGPKHVGSLDDPHASTERYGPDAALVRAEWRLGRRDLLEQETYNCFVVDPDANDTIGLAPSVAGFPQHPANPILSGVRWFDPGGDPDWTFPSPTSPELSVPSAFMWEQMQEVRERGDWVSWFSGHSRAIGGLFYRLGSPMSTVEQMAIVGNEATPGLLRAYGMPSCAVKANGFPVEGPMDLLPNATCSYAMDTEAFRRVHHGATVGATSFEAVQGLSAGVVGLVAEAPHGLPHGSWTAAWSREQVEALTGPWLGTLQELSKQAKEIVAGWDLDDPLLHNLRSMAQLSRWGTGGAPEVARHSTLTPEETFDALVLPLAYGARRGVAVAALLNAHENRLTPGERETAQKLNDLILNMAVYASVGTIAPVPHAYGVAIHAVCCELTTAAASRGLEVDGEALQRAADAPVPSVHQMMRSTSTLATFAR